MKTIQPVSIYTDGATVGWNGKLGTVTQVGLGVYLKTTPEIKIFRLVNGISNNEAEFKALILAMEEAISYNIKHAIFHCDSQIVINRANGSRPKKKKFANPRMDAFQDKVTSLSANFESIKFQWIPREHNSIADLLSKKAVSLA